MTKRARATGTRGGKNSEALAERRVNDMVLESGNTCWRLRLRAELLALKFLPGLVNPSMPLSSSSSLSTMSNLDSSLLSPQWRRRPHQLLTSHPSNHTGQLAPGGPGMPGNIIRGFWILYTVVRRGGSPVFFEDRLAIMGYHHTQGRGWAMASHSPADVHHTAGLVGREAGPSRR
ncbi:nuclear factor interleukin-3-regulated protein-like protein [Lates japonicus]|uniref:Nuclear factor interleukin-3-regulated protein-like protein n=1 Tax=Lates japonicus TaxID=270547 RepID=A0AAD3N7Z8_LATJO|nr:nuclear factor interleukin-3-regulated protein-like protein [Lates japonicus]